MEEGKERQDKKEKGGRGPRQNGELKSKKIRNEEKIGSVVLEEL